MDLSTTTIKTPRIPPRSDPMGAHDLKVIRLRSRGSLRSLLDHVFGSESPPNADTASIPPRRSLIGSRRLVEMVAARRQPRGPRGSPCGREPRRRLYPIWAMALKIDRALLLESRSDEGLLTTPRPLELDRARVELWCGAAMSWAKSTLGVNLLSADLHLDEAAPHIHIVVRAGRRSARYYQASYQGRLIASSLVKPIDGPLASDQAA